MDNRKTCLSFIHDAACMLKADNANGLYIFAIRVSANYTLRSDRILRAPSAFIHSFLHDSFSFLLVGQIIIIFQAKQKKKRLISGFLSDFSTAAKESNTQTHFQQPQVYFINRHSRIKKTNQCTIAGHVNPEKPIMEK